LNYREKARQRVVQKKVAIGFSRKGNKRGKKGKRATTQKWVGKERIQQKDGAEDRNKKSQNLVHIRQGVTSVEMYKWSQEKDWKEQRIKAKRDRAQKLHGSEPSHQSGDIAQGDPWGKREKPQHPIRPSDCLLGKKKRSWVARRTRLKRKEMSVPRFQEGENKSRKKEIE